jgi:hypothetical protein
MACDKPSSPSAADATALARGGRRIQLQLAMCTDDDRDETGTDIAPLTEGSRRIEPLGVTRAASAR